LNLLSALVIGLTMGCGESKEVAMDSTTTPGQADNVIAERSFLNVTASARASVVGGGGKGGGRAKMGNVFATPLDILGVKDGHNIPIHVKSSEETDFLKEKLAANFIFEHLTKRELNRLVDAFEKTEVTGSGVDIIKQGDVGDFFYVLHSGSVEFVVNDHTVGNAQAGSSFGELALLYKSPRAATVKTMGENTVLFRVDQLTFRFILQAQTKEAVSEKVALLKMVSFLKDLNTTEINKLAAVMTPKKFSKGDYIMRKGDPADFFYILGEGSVTAKNVAVGEAKFEDLTLAKRGDYFGERALVTGEPRAADIVADNEATAFAIDKDTFESVLGNYNKIIVRAQDKRLLEGIKVFADSKLNEAALTTLVSLLEERTVKKGDVIYKKGNTVSPPTIYLVRSGEVSVEGTETRIGTGGYFGDDQLLVDVTTQDSEEYPSGTPPSFTPTSTVSAVEDCALAVLTLTECRKVFNTRKIGTPGAGEVLQTSREMTIDSPIDSSIKLPELKKHNILGQGTFGQVWLVSRKAKNRKNVAYALKIQSKFELIRDGQAQAVVYEKNVMMKLNHPLILPLVNTYQDEDFVYMLLGLVQGGELYSYIHRHDGDGVKEEAARFYAAGIGEVLGFMHRKGFVYRYVMNSCCKFFLSIV
jgi:cAMP-dependent protein kinase regulator